MVFDVAGNKVGDTHWNGNVALQEGDEVTLEKWGVVVDVSERVRQTVTDLSEIRPAQKKASPRLTSLAIQSPAPGVSYRSVSQPKHKSLNTLLSSTRQTTPSRPRVPVLPAHGSPFERTPHYERAEGTPSKRIRLDGPQVSGKQRTSNAPIHSRLNSSCALNISARRNVLVERQSIASPEGPAEVIDLCGGLSDASETFQGFSSDILPTSPVVPPSDLRSGGCKTFSTHPEQRTIKTRDARDQSAQKGSEPRKYALPNRNEPGVEELQSMEKSSGKQVSTKVDTPSTAEQRRSLSAITTAKGPQSMTLKIAATTTRRKKALLCQKQLLPNHVPSGASSPHQAPIVTPHQPARTRAASLLADPEHVPERVDPCIDDEDLMELHGDTDRGDHLYDDIAPSRQRSNSLVHLAQPRRDQSHSKPSGSLARVTAAEVRETASASNRKKTPSKGRAVPAVALPKQVEVELCDAVDRPAEATETPSGEQQGRVKPIDRTNKPNVPSKTAPVPPRISAKKQTTSITQAAGALPKDLGPWSREAFDLFVWRPPGWNEEKWCVEEQKT
jgi:hypothetical protein